jgi:hypothetical protein
MGAGIVLQEFLYHSYSRLVGSGLSKSLMIVTFVITFGSILLVTFLRQP